MAHSTGNRGEAAEAIQFGSRDEVERHYLPNASEAALLSAPTASEVGKHIALHSMDAFRAALDRGTGRPGE